MLRLDSRQADFDQCLQRLIQFLLGDDQGRGQPDRRSVGVLGDEQRTVGSLSGAVLDDRLGDGGDVCLVEGGVKT